MSGPEQSCRERLHQPRGKRKEKGNQMHLSHTGLGISMRINTSSCSGRPLEWMTAKLHVPHGTPDPEKQAQLYGRHTACPETQGRFDSGLRLRGTHLHCCLLPKLPPMLCASNSCLGRRVISVATHKCTSVFNVQQEVHKLCHAGGRDSPNILKHYCPQEPNREENKMDEG